MIPVIRRAYDHLTTVDITPTTDGTRVVMTIDPAAPRGSDRRIRACRENELDRLAKVAG